MTPYLTYLRRPSTIVWAVLVSATVVSWTLGTDHSGFIHDPRMATSIVLALSFVKVQLVGTYFMELELAPRALQGVFSGWVLITFLVINGIYLFA